MMSAWFGLLLSLVCCTGHNAEAAEDISPYIRHYETVGYDRRAVDRQHQRARREVQQHSSEVQLDFKAFHRAFHLRLTHDKAGFADDFTVRFSNISQVADLSHLYSGKLEGEGGSSCHGSIINGQFEGFIHTKNGTYYVEPFQRHSTSHSNHHSIIYHEDNIDLSPLERDGGQFCGAEQLKDFVKKLRSRGGSEGEPPSRSKRTVDNSKTSCLLHLHADYLFFKKFGSVEAVVGQVASYIRAVNDIYDQADFEGVRLVNFNVKTLSVIREEDPTSPLAQTFVGPEKLLSLFSRTNWDSYCLSYLLTNRDYSGVLGLAWEGMPGNLGGICSQFAKTGDGEDLSLNTGLVTLQNYGRSLTLMHVQLTLAHELGHSLGAPHDEGSNCGDVGTTGQKGHYLMFPQATNEIKENNDKFSPCSTEHISRILHLKKDRCFVASDRPICGNLIVDKGEECDVGNNVSDPCCHSAKEPEAIQCRLKPNKMCSPSQGPCCSSSCDFKPSGMACKAESECQQQSQCPGNAAACPVATAKPNMTVCSVGTRICYNGECARSLCVKYGLEQCDCPGQSMMEKCYMCCQQPGNAKTCASTTSSALYQFFQGKRLPLVPGAPCSANQGYCDKFHICRLLDADGPIARLKNSFLHLKDFDDLSDWMKAYWWAILAAILTLSAVMASTAYLIGRPLKAEQSPDTPAETSEIPW